VQDLNLFQAGTTSSAVTLIEQGTSVANIAVFAANTTQQTQIAFTGAAGVTVAVTNFENLPGQGPLPGMDAQLFTVTITAAQNAALGDRGLQLTNADGTTGAALPGMLSAVAPGTLAKHPAPKEPKATAAAWVPIAGSPVAQPAADSLGVAGPRWRSAWRLARTRSGQ
jgi:hypothetical protein